MGMMVNSIYTHKEIFMREIISNASDALDKLCYIALTEQIEGYDRSKLEIRVSFDKPNRLLTVEDNGIGMNEDDLENDLGVIARSGSLDFNVKLQQAGTDDDLSGLIGQFGVGFYSVFMVADKVTVRTRRYDCSQGYEWSSGGAEGYEIRPCEVPVRGTTVILHIREDGDEKDEYSQYLREYPVYKLIRKYSDYVRWPIRMRLPHPELKPGCGPAAPEYTEVFDYETVNSMCPIWKKKRSEVSDGEYEEFYKEHFDDKADTLKVMKVSVDGNVSYEALLFIPSEVSADYGSEGYKRGPELYSGGVKIMEHCEALLPDYYSFVRGVVETGDVSLNVSRELLQQDRQLRMISQSVEKKIRGSLEQMLSDERDVYERFFARFGRHLKACAMEDFGKNRDKLQDLLLFVSSKENKPVTLKEYVAGMKPDQKYIFYTVASTVEEAASLPQTGVLKERGYEILYFVDKVDELVTQMFGNYHDIQFKSVVNGELGLDEVVGAQAGGEDQKVLDYIRTVLGGRIDEVRLSSRLGSHPVILTSGDGITFEMEQYFKSLRPDMPVHAKKILELNGTHAAFAKLKDAIGAEPERAEKYVEILYQQGRMMAGLKTEDPVAYTELICSLW